MVQKKNGFGSIFSAATGHRATHLIKMGPPRCFLVCFLLALVVGSSYGMRTTPFALVRRVVGSVGCAFALAGPVGAAIPSDAMQRWKTAASELEALDKDWDTIVKGEGDNVRRRLGTVYAPPKCLPALCSFNLFVPRFIVDNSDDIDMDTFEGPSGELLEALNQADFTAYSAVFSDYGNGGGGANYIEQSRAQVQRSIKVMKQILSQLEAAK